MKLAPIAVAACLAATALRAADPPSPRCDVLPGWTQAGPARLYASDNLYDYMDGNSEGYLVYGFKLMHGVTCKSGEVSFVVDISEMNDAEAAWGLYASNRDPRLPVEALGLSGQIVPQRGIFVKGTSFVEISASPTSIDHTPAIRNFLTALEKCIAGAVDAPAPVTWFPKEGLDEASIRLIPQSLLGLSLLKKGYLAKYDYGRAFIVRQPTPEAAILVMQKLRDRFGNTTPATTADESFQANDRYLGRLVIFRKGPYLAGFVNLTAGAPVAKSAQTLAAAIP